MVPVQLAEIEEMVGGSASYHRREEKRNASLGFSHGQEQFLNESEMALGVRCRRPRLPLLLTAPLLLETG